jgi:hypothetical protein
MGSFYRFIDRQDQGRFKLDRARIAKPARKWSSVAMPLKQGSVGRVHMLLSTHVDTRGLSREQYRKVINWPWKHSLARKPKPQPAPEPAHAPKPISPEEAEQLSKDMIKSFSSCRLMRELLEDAKYFVGATGLVGAPPSRRARTTRSTEVTYC